MADDVRKSGRPGGRPTKLTPATQDRIVRALRIGATWEMASHAAGVSYACVRDWKVKGRNGVQPYVGFVAACEQAEAEGGMAALARIVQAADKGDRRAAQYLLTTRYHYGRRTAGDLPDEPDGLEGMLASATRMRRAAEADGSYVAAASLLASEQRLRDQIAERDAAARREALAEVPEAELVASIAEALEGLSPEQRAALLARLGS